VASNVPTGLGASLRKERVAAGNIFFGMDLVELISSPIALIGNREKTNAMNGSRGRAETGKMQAKLVPGKVREVEKREQNKHGKHDAAPGKNRICWENC
jgi:hypothetical protein